MTDLPSFWRRKLEIRKFLPAFEDIKIPLAPPSFSPTRQGVRLLDVFVDLGDCQSACMARLHCHPSQYIVRTVGLTIIGLVAVVMGSSAVGYR